jgi:cysteine synthase A
MPPIATAFTDIAEATLLPRVVSLGPNLFGAVFSLMKLVPARYILRRAAVEGKIGPDTVVVETTSGTFGLALAMETALMRRKLILVSDPVISGGLLARLNDLGAVVDIVRRPHPRGGYQQARLDRLAAIRREQPDSFCPEQYSNPANPASYAVVAEHLLDALGSVDCLIGPVGSGGSMCGTTRELRTVSPQTVAIGVDTPGSVLFGHPDGDRQLRGLGNSLMPANLTHETFDEVHWCPPADAYAMTRRLHRRHALYQGPTSGAAYLAARWWAERNPDARCVVMLPDEGYRYAASVYDDGWLAEQGHALDRVPDGPMELFAPNKITDRWARFAWGRRTLGEVLADDVAAI